MDDKRRGTYVCGVRILKGNVEVFVPKEMNEMKDKIDPFVEFAEAEDADLLFSTAYINSEKPVCVQNINGFDVLYQGKTSHLEDHDPLLAIMVAMSLKEGFKSTFVYRNKMRVMISRMLQSFVINGEVEGKNSMSHSERVTILVKKFAPVLGIKKQDVKLLLEYSMLHDVGKIGLEQLMLYTPTRIREWLHTGQDHTIVGSIFLATTVVLEDAASIARSHHERWDGKGYPDGLKGEEIPYYARIIGICDFYDEALNTVSSEILGRPLNETEVLDLIESESGEAFDPVIDKKFVEFMRKELGMQ